MRKVLASGKEDLLVEDSVVDFQTAPEDYQHWQLLVEPPLATLFMNVKEDGGLGSGYELKLNSYDLGVDIELHDAIQRLRFEHPNVGAIIITSAKPRVFSSGANIKMLASATHAAKVNFCKFTNETRCAMEQATALSGQSYIAALNGAASGGGYELALSCEHIILIDDGSSRVALPELPLLGVLPATGGLTRLVDKRKIRRDYADILCTTAEGIGGKRAVDWGLVDELTVPSKLEEAAVSRARLLVGDEDRTNRKGVGLTPLSRKFGEDKLEYSHLSIELNSTTSVATFTICGPENPCPVEWEEALTQGPLFWPLQLVRELDDAILHLRTNRPDISCWVFKVSGTAELLNSYDSFLLAEPDNWFSREIRLFWVRTLKRLDVTSRSLISVIDSSSGFSGTLFDLALACDRIYMLDEKDVCSIGVNEMNFGGLPMANGLSRLENRFMQDQESLGKVRRRVGEKIWAGDASQLGLVTSCPDEIDWDEELRLAIEERSSFSGDALTGLEANLRFSGPETIETKIFGRLSAWQNWVFQRPNAAGDEGALRRYGTGKRPIFDRKRV
ncbi:MAG: benzoyl-CoA-dihydrodiol lyase [Rhodospirillaceae bacterium]|nr:benzoyl-CoA-dihydrodiol lyase [Rhodospirillaceae bacterium]|tara:strand:+ start:466 stop:2145 length:1680 start_codon:yes stop_codon:yes gene_type:complete